MVSGGRGRGLTLPSWMTKGVTDAPPPSIPDLPNEAENAGQAPAEPEKHALDDIFEERDKDTVGTWRKRSRSRTRKGKGKGKGKKGKGKNRNEDRRGGWGSKDEDGEDEDWAADEGAADTAAADAEAAEQAPWNNKASGWNSGRHGSSWSSGGDGWKKQSSWGSRSSSWSGSSWNKQDWNSQSWQGNSKQSWDRGSSKAAWKSSQDDWNDNSGGTKNDWNEDSGGDQEWATGTATASAPASAQEEQPAWSPEDAAQHALAASMHNVAPPPPPAASVHNVAPPPPPVAAAQEPPQALAAVGGGGGTTYGSSAGAKGGGHRDWGRGGGCSGPVRSPAPLLGGADQGKGGVTQATHAHVPQASHSGAPSAFSSAGAAAAARQRLVQTTQRGSAVVMPPPRKAPAPAAPIGLGLTAVRPAVSPGVPGGFLQMPTVPANSGVTVPRPVRAAAPPLQSFAQDGLSIPGLEGLFAGLGEPGKGMGD